MTLEIKSVEELKSFVGIQFKKGGQNDVIHKLWIKRWTEKEKTVLYPPSIYDVRVYAREKRTPSEEWKEYAFIPLCHSSK